MKNRKEPFTKQNRQKGQETEVRFLASYFMIEASLSDSVSDQPNGGNDERLGVRAPGLSLCRRLPQNDQNREWYLPQISQGDPQRRGLKMAQPSEPAAAEVAAVIGVAIYNRLPVVAL